MPRTKTGGKREGAGRPPLYAQPMARKEVTLDADTIRRATKLGGGNLSAGIREAFKRRKAE